MADLESRQFDLPKENGGPYLARVISNADNRYMGALQVQLLRDVGNTPRGTASTITVQYLSPFFGSTSIDFVGSNATHNDTQKSYGMWMVPPDPGSIVVVIFIEGSWKKGYWIGCVQDDFMNFMVPGLAATTAHSETGSTDKKVVSEYNKRTTNLEDKDFTKLKKPVHPFQDVLNTQGLAKDETRGITTSSARRESPSAVFGISTPGPIDKRAGAPKASYGKKESQITGAFISRLGGTTFVMDDGDESFVRKTEARDGPSEYVNVEAGEKGGRPDIPHNELFRIRTRTGHQILLHNSEDLIYIANSKGTAWIELTANGKIDIYAGDSVSIHSGTDFNFVADRDINFVAGQNINVLSAKEIRTSAGKSISTVAGTFMSSNAGESISANAGTFISNFAGSSITMAAQTNAAFMAGTALTVNAVGQLNIEACGNIVAKGAQVHINGPDPGTASPDSPVAPVSAQQASRVPTHEPWMQHENLNPKAFTPDKTRAGSSPASAGYSSIPDTFRKNT